MPLWPAGAAATHCRAGRSAAAALHTGGSDARSWQDAPGRAAVAGKRCAARLRLSMHRPGSGARHTNALHECDTGRQSGQRAPERAGFQVSAVCATMICMDDGCGPAMAGHGIDGRAAGRLLLHGRCAGVALNPGGARTDACATARAAGSPDSGSPSCPPWRTARPPCRGLSPSPRHTACCRRGSLARR